VGAAGGAEYDDSVEDEPIPARHLKLHEVSASVHVSQVDPTSPLLSIKTWEELNLPDDLLKGIYHKGFSRPSKIQESALPLIIGSPNNLIAQAQNGSGKTATFALSMLSKIDRHNKNPQSMCLCPTRELARQNIDVIKELGQFTNITSWLVVPMCSRYDRAMGAQIIVGTPGKVKESLQKKSFPQEDMALFVLDEADVMIDHRNNMAPQVSQIRRFFRQPMQVLLFSATYPEEVRAFAQQVVPVANLIRVKKEDLTLSSVAQFFIECRNDDHKFTVLSDLYGCLSLGQSVIFVNSRKRAFDIASKMQINGHAVSIITGSDARGPEKMDHEMRETVMSEFRKGETKVLIATDLLSRGIDVPQVTLVINYDLPIDRNSSSDVDTETYIHRIGRTGRFGLKGIAINLVSMGEVGMLDTIRNFYSCNINRLSEDPEQIEEKVRCLRE